MCALLILRVVGAEPYSVPTGSMAPALVGNHRAVDCPRCGYTIRLGLSHGRSERHGSQRENVCCPNCGCEQISLDGVPISRGDQLLVNKNVYDWRSPRRWEMAVFRCPVEPGKEFVKRVIGLPGETVQLRDGDVYVDHELARKTLAELRWLRVPVFDQNFQPPEGWQSRWETTPVGGPAFVEGADLRIDAADEASEAVWLGYRNWSLDRNKEEPFRDEYSYNGSDYSSTSAVHDFMFECDLEVLQGDGKVMLGITDGRDDVVVELPVGAVKEGTRLLCCQSSDTDGDEKVHRTAPTFALAAGKTYHLELAFVDRRVTLAIDGKQPFAPVDRPAAEQRGEVSRPVKVGACGVAIRVRNFRIFRDVHYTEAGRHGVRAPVRLGAGQYFVLGDNSPNSDDNRFWSDREDRPLPVHESAFVGRPFLIHLPSRATQWQAFGRRWEHQGIDWGRIHWVR